MVLMLVVARDWCRRGDEDVQPGNHPPGIHGTIVRRNPVKPKPVPIERLLLRVGGFGELSWNTHEN